MKCKKCNGTGTEICRVCQGTGNVPDVVKEEIFDKMKKECSYYFTPNGCYYNKNIETLCRIKNCPLLK